MHVCLFDIDGTLLRSGGAGQSAMEAAITREFSIELDASDIPCSGRTDRAITQDFFRKAGLGYTSDAVLRFQRRYFELLPQHLGEKEGFLCPGVPELLDQLSSRDDVLLGLLTGNYEQGAWLKLKHYQLDHHFEFGGFGDVHAERNAVANLARVTSLQRLRGTAPHAIWVIGDTPNDVRCGRHIGAKTVAVTTGNYSREQLEESRADAVFDDLSNADAFLDLLATPNGYA